MVVINWQTDPLLLDQEPTPMNEWLTANKILESDSYIIDSFIDLETLTLNLYPILVRKIDFVREKDSDRILSRFPFLVLTDEEITLIKSKILLIAEFARDYFYKSTNSGIMEWKRRLQTYLKRGAMPYPLYRCACALVDLPMTNPHIDELFFESAKGKRYSIPIKLTKSLAYLCGVANGDGHLHRHCLRVTDETKEFMILLSKLYEQIFNDPGEIFQNENAWNVELRSSTVVRIINFLTDQTIEGAKYDSLREPLLFKQFGVPFRNIYWRGAMDADGGAHIPGPKIVPEFAINIINSLLKKELIWENVIRTLYSMILKSDKYSELGILLFEEIRELISEKTFRSLTFELISNVSYRKGDGLKDQLDCLKGFEEFWLPILLDSSDEGLSYLSNLDLSSYDFTVEDLEKIYSFVKISLESQKELNFNPTILIYLHGKGYSIIWTDFFKFIGISEETDSFFRSIIPVDLAEEKILTKINTLDESDDKILVALVLKINDDYYEDYLKAYLLGLSSINDKTLFQKWLIELFNDDRRYLNTIRLESRVKRWLIEKSDKINFLESIITNKQIDFNRLTKLLEQLSYYYGRDYYQGIENEIELKVRTFWDKNYNENIIRIILIKMIESAKDKYYSSHKYWIKQLFPFIDEFADLEKLSFDYITNLLSYEGTNYYDNNLIFYLNENPHKKFHELLIKSLENITKKIEIKNITNALKYRLYFIYDEEFLDKKKELRIKSKKEKEYFKKIISLVINKDIELLEKSVYNEIEFNNFELIDLASRLDDSLICHYIKKLLQHEISDYYIGQLLDSIEKYCNISLMKNELEKIETKLLKYLDDMIKEENKLKVTRLKKLIKKCKKMID